MRNFKRILLALVVLVGMNLPAHTVLAEGDRGNSSRPFSGKQDMRNQDRQYETGGGHNRQDFQNRQHDDERPFGKERGSLGQRGGHEGAEGHRRGGFDREKLREELMALPPEERKQRMQQMRGEHKEKMQQRRERLEQRWQSADETERKQFCQKVQHKCQQEGKKFACHMAQSKCSR